MSVASTNDDSSKKRCEASVQVPDPEITRLIPEELPLASLINHWTDDLNQAPKRRMMWRKWFTDLITSPACHRPLLYKVSRLTRTEKE